MNVLYFYYKFILCFLFGKFIYFKQINLKKHFRKTCNEIMKQILAKCIFMIYLFVMLLKINV